MAPSWFELLAWVALGLGFASALVIVADIVVLGNWQHMAIMDLAFPLTALYLGPIALWAYFARGRRMSRRRMHMHMAGVEEGPRDSLWQVSLSDSHCGAGCVLGDIVGEWIVWATAWMIGSTAELEVDRLGLTAVVDDREQLDPFRLQHALQAGDRFFDRPGTLFRCHAIASVSITANTVAANFLAPPVLAQVQLQLE